MRLRILLWACCLVQCAYSQQFVWEKKYSLANETFAQIESFDFDRGNYIIHISHNTPDKNARAYLNMANDKGEVLWMKTFQDTIFSDLGNSIKFLNGKAYFFAQDYKGNTDTLDIAIFQIDKPGNIKKLNTYHFRDYIFNYCEVTSIVTNNRDSLFVLSRCGNEKIPGNVNLGGAKAVYTKFDSLGISYSEQLYPYNDSGYISMFPSTLVNFNNKLIYYAEAFPTTIDYPFLIKIRKDGSIVDSSFIKELANNYTSSDIRNGYSQFQWGRMIYDQAEHLYLTGVYGWVNAQKQARGKFFIAKVDTNFNFKWVLRCSGQNEKGTLAQSRMNLLPNGNILLSGFEVGNTGLRIYNIHPDGTILDSIRLQSQITTGKGYRSMTHSHYFAEDSTLVVSGQLDGTAYLAKVDLKKFLLLNTDEEVWAGNAFTVSPNPCANYLHLQIPKQGTLELYNVQGQLVQKQKITVNMTELDISQLNTGSYMYRFMMEDGVKYGKIVKE